MAVPTYNSDLTLLTNAESGTWVEMTGWAVGDAPLAEGDYYIQGAGCRSSDTNNKTGLCSGCFDYGSSLSASFTANVTCVFMWHVLLPANAMSNYASGGLRAIVGADVSNFSAWRVGGSDKGRNPYGGWQCYAVNPAKTADYTVGTGHGGTYRFFGAAADVISNISKGTMHGWDAMYYGRGQILFDNGSVSDGAATFDSMATANDNQNNRWGLFQKEGTGYLWKGLMSFGEIAACYFVDSNINITIDDTPATYATFNKIEIKNTGSVITWNNVNIIALLSTQLSKGDFEMVDNATVNLTACSFTDMNTFIFNSNATITDSTFRRCNTITQNNAIFSYCIFSNSTASSTLISDNPSDLNGCTFDSDGSNHAIELTTACAGNSYNLTNHEFNGYATSNGSTGNEVIYNNSGGAVTLNASNITGTVSVRNGTGSTTTVVSSVPVSIVVVDVANTPIQTAQVAVYQTSDDTQLVNTDTDVNGEVSFGYGGSTPQAIYIRVRKSSTGATKYLPVSSSGTITGTGFAATITLIEDTTATI